MNDVRFSLPNRTIRAAPRPLLKIRKTCITSGKNSPIVSIYKLYNLASTWSELDLNSNSFNTFKKYVMTFYDRSCTAISKSCVLRKNRKGFNRVKMYK